MTSKGAFVNISLQHERRERTLNSGMRIDTPVERIVKTVLSIMVRMLFDVEWACSILAKLLT